jgi:hypothetical protein
MENNINPETGLPHWTELDVVRLLDAGKTYIELVDEAMTAVLKRREFEKEMQGLQERCDRAVYTVEGMHRLYNRIFCNTEQKMGAQFRDNSEINEMRDKLFEKDQEYRRFMG